MGVVCNVEDAPDTDEVMKTQAYDTYQEQMPPPPPLKVEPVQTRRSPVKTVTTPAPAPVSHTYVPPSTSYTPYVPPAPKQ